MKSFAPLLLLLSPLVSSIWLDNFPPNPQAGPWMSMYHYGCKPANDSQVCYTHFSTCGFIDTLGYREDGTRITVDEGRIYKAENGITYTVLHKTGTPNIDTFGNATDEVCEELYKYYEYDHDYCAMYDRASRRHKSIEDVLFARKFMRRKYQDRGIPYDSDEEDPPENCISRSTALETSSPAQSISNTGSTTLQSTVSASFDVHQRPWFVVPMNLLNTLIL